MPLPQNPQRPGGDPGHLVQHDAARHRIMPPENTNWDMIAITSSGMICSLDLASADNARPTIAAHTVVAATST